MYTIKHRVVMETSPAKLFTALHTQDGLGAWWTDNTTTGEAGSVASFRFGPQGEHVVDMTLVEVQPSSKLVWQCTSGPWAATGPFTFTIMEDARGAALTFEHSGWAEQDDFYAHCNTKWGYFLATSLKNYLETGTGQPHPLDPSI